MEQWSSGTRALGAVKIVLEKVDDMVFATSKDNALIYGNWSLSALFGWVYVKPIRWNTRYRKLVDVK